jgi:hypothetical protein
MYVYNQAYLSVESPADLVGTFEVIEMYQV